MINPILYPGDWRQFKIGSQYSPGICVVGKGKRQAEWDIPRGKGAMGGVMKFVGLKPMKFAITITLWRMPGITGPFDPDDHADWAAFMPMLKYDPLRKDVQAIDFYHPSFDGLDVLGVVCESIGNKIARPHQPTVYDVEVEFIQFLNPGPTAALGTPTTIQQETPEQTTTKGHPPTLEDLQAQLAQQAFSPTQ